MNLLKQSITLLLLFVAMIAQSQTLDNYISNQSISVVEVSGDQIFSLISNSDIAGMMPPSSTGEPIDISELGFDVSKKAYYYTQIVDSIMYHNFIIGISDFQSASETIGGMLPPPLSKVEGYDFSIAGGMCGAWNADRAIFSYFDVPKVEYTIEDILEEKRKAKEENSSDDTKEENEFQLEGDGSMEELEDELLYKNLFAPNAFSEEELKDMLGAHVTSILNTNAINSVSSLASYKEGKVSNSSVYFWVNDVDGIIKDNIDPSEFSELAYLSSAPDMILGIKEVTGNLIFDKDEIEMTTLFAVDEKLVESYNKMYSSKMDKSFLKYFDKDDVMAYMSFSTDVANALKEYPTMMETLYGSWAADYSEEVDVAADILSVIIDEDAIGELVTGDGLILIHDVEQNEVTYKTFEYDEEYNATEVEKTKMEPLPMFSIMLGSKNEKIINKLMKLTRKYKVAEYDNGHHRFLAKDLGAPFDIYFTYNDGIAFFTNSTTRLNNYKTGKKICNLGDHKKVLRDNMFNMYVNASATINKLNNFYPMDPHTTNYLASNYKEVYMTMTNMKEGKFGFDMKFKTSGAKNNALKLILDTVKELTGGAQQ